MKREERLSEACRILEGNEKAQSIFIELANSHPEMSIFWNIEPGNEAAILEGQEVCVMINKYGAE